MNVTGIRTAISHAMERIAANQPRSWADELPDAAAPVRAHAMSDAARGTEPTMSGATAGLLTLGGVAAGAGSAYGIHRLVND